MWFFMVVVAVAALMRGVIATTMTPADLEMGEEGEMTMAAEDAGLPELADLEMGEGGDMDMGDENYSDTTAAPSPSPSPTPSLVPVPSPVPNQPNVISIQPPAQAPCPATAADNSPVVVNVSVGDDCCDDEDEGSHVIVDDGHTRHFNHKWSRHPSAHGRPSDDARLVPRERPVITV